MQSSNGKRLILDENIVEGKYEGMEGGLDTSAATSTGASEHIKSGDALSACVQQTTRRVFALSSFRRLLTPLLACLHRGQAWIRDLGIGPKTSYVVYIIRVQRIRDGASSVTAQRYSALRNLYNELKVRPSTFSGSLWVAACASRSLIPPAVAFDVKKNDVDK